MRVTSDILTLLRCQPRNPALYVTLELLSNKGTCRTSADAAIGNAHSFAVATSTIVSGT